MSKTKHSAEERDKNVQTRKDQQLRGIKITLRPATWILNWVNKLQHDMLIRKTKRKCN